MEIFIRIKFLPMHAIGKKLFCEFFHTTPMYIRTHCPVPAPHAAYITHIDWSIHYTSWRVAAWLAKLNLMKFLSEYKV